ncbi:MAG: TIGR03960 family B12-binding radical SAM protein [Clostridia bacterium]|nr:TIGR03960 family B12-binding radical SAM protein [Clostridia bacterium]MDD4386809.1 TIGR03960 family B12-binding radical SAM protein [Clostridia bacterium]
MLKLNSYDLKKVMKPARYVGNEYNQILKNKQEIDLRFAMCFPDIYDVGMSNLGMKILYDILNKRKDTWCERVFAPWKDFEDLMRKKKVKLYGLESKDYIDTFDFIGFTLQYEMSYTNILNMLDLSNIPVYSKDRQIRFPFVIAGGPCTANPYPLSPFIDIFVIGDAEEVLNILMDKYVQWKKNKLPKRIYLESIKDIQGIFIPLIHTKNDIIKKIVVQDLNNVAYPLKPIVPSTEIIQDRISLEIFRGCSRGCRFCQAGYIYRPVREKSIDKLLEIASCNIKSTGHNEISLFSLSTSDYPDFLELADRLLKFGEDKRVSLSLPSLRIDSMNVDIINKIQSVRKSSLTFAPEAGSQRLRDVINKNITESEILASSKLAFENGYTSLKLYFMIGLPTEDYADLNAIVELCNKIIDEYYKIPKENRKGKFLLTVSTSTFVPKSHTPFQWCSQATLEKIELKQQFLKDKLSKKSIKYNWHNPLISRLEALIARGDEKVGRVIYSAWRLGAKFDSWDECFNVSAWNKALERENIKIEDYSNKQYDLDTEFCWDNIFCGVDKEFLKREYIKALEEKTTPRCSISCSSCGVTKIAKCNFLNK